MPIDEKLLQAKRQLSQLLLGKAGVVGVGISKSAEGNDVLTVHLEAGAPRAVCEVPESFDGYPVQELRGGPFRKFAASKQ